MKPSRSTGMPEHVCQRATGCSCYQLASEPDENCPQHGWPIPRCDCGRFVARRQREVLQELKELALSYNIEILSGGNNTLPILGQPSDPGPGILGHTPEDGDTASLD